LTSKKTREIGQSTEDLVAEMLEARTELRATSALKTTVVGSCPTDLEVFICLLGERYSAQNEMYLSCVSVSDTEIAALGVSELARFETRDYESQRMFHRADVKFADLHDQTVMTGSITLIGEKGIECPEGKMLRQESATKDTTEKGSAMVVVFPLQLILPRSPLYRSPALFCRFAESSDVVENTDEDLSGEVYDGAISPSDDVH